MTYNVSSGTLNTTIPCHTPKQQFGSEPPSVEDDVDVWRYAILRPVYSDSTQLNSTRQREQQFTQSVGRDIINKNTTDLAVRCSAGSVELS